MSCVSFIHEYEVWSISFGIFLKVQFIYARLLFRSVDVNQIFVVMFVGSPESVSASFITARKFSEWSQTLFIRVCFYLPFKNDENRREIGHWIYEGLFLFWFTFEIHNQYHLHSCMPSSLAPNPIRVQACVWCLFWTNRNSMAVTSIFLSISALSN